MIRIYSTFLLLLIFFPLVLSLSPGKPCMRCVGGHYKITNQLLGASEFSMEMKIDDDWSRDCSKAPLEDCQGTCIGIFLYDLRGAEPGLSGAVIGCSTHTIHVDKPITIFISDEDELILETMEETVAFAYKFFLQTKEKGVEKKESIPWDQSVVLPDAAMFKNNHRISNRELFVVVCYFFVLIFVLLSVIVFFRQPHLI